MRTRGRPGRTRVAWVPCNKNHEGKIGWFNDKGHTKRRDSRGLQINKNQSLNTSNVGFKSMAGLLEAHMCSLGGNWQIRGWKITFSFSFFIYIQHLNESRRFCAGDLELLDIENIIISSSSHACQIVRQMHFFNLSVGPNFASKQKNVSSRKNRRKFRLIKFSYSHRLRNRLPTQGFSEHTCHIGGGSTFVKEGNGKQLVSSSDSSFF